jgi:hypothetical protein
MAYRVTGKVELPPKNLGDNAEGIPRNTKVGLDLKVYGDDGKELDNEGVIAAGLAWKTRFGFRHESGAELVFEGKGAQEEDGKVKRFTSGAAKGKSVPVGGYTLDGPGISALEHSNGFRMMVNFKKVDEGYYTAFGEIEGAGTAQFPKGDTFRVGKAKSKGGKGEKHG